MNWKFQPAAGLFEEVRNAWDDLNQRQGNHILLDSRFVGPLLRYFGRNGVLLGINENSRRPSMALLVKKNPSFWETFQPSQAPLGLILLGHRDDTGEALFELLCCLSRYSLELSVLRQDPDISVFPPSFNHPRIRVLDFIQTARLRLAGTFEGFWQSRSSNLRHNLRRQRRRLAEQGHTLEFVCHQAPSEVAACLREYARLESHGWKGRRGTAVTENNSQGRYYGEILETFCARGEGVVFQLLLDGKVVASDLCLSRNGVLVVLKTAHDESFPHFSLAGLMRQEIISHLYAENRTRVVEYYGRVMDWHISWSNDTRMMYHVNCFRHTWMARAWDIVRLIL